MTYLPQINRVIQQGRGIAARVIGQTYAQYRINSNTVGSVISTNSLVTSSFKMYLDKSSKVNIENTTFDLMVFEGTCDGTKLEVGDILVENGYGADAGIYCVAQLRPRKPNILVRVESQSAYEKPHPDAGAVEDQPSTGLIWRQGLTGGTRVGSRYELTLQGGLYSMQAQGLGTPASLPIGFQGERRVRSAHKPDLPTIYPAVDYLLYLPPTPGYIPQQLDVVKGMNAESFSIQMVYTSGEAGLQGFICVAELINT